MVNEPMPSGRATERGSRWPGSERLRQSPAAAMVLFALALYLLRLALVAASGASLHVDEAQYWHWSRDLHWGYFTKPPLIAALIRLSTALFGDGELGVKALAMACYPLTAVVIMQIGTEMADRRVGVLAAILFLCSPMVGILGMAASTDAPLLLAWALALWAMWRVLQPGPAFPGAAGAADGRHDAAWAAVGAALALGVLAKYTMAAFAPSALALVAWRVRPLPWRGVAIATAAALALLTPHLAWNLAEHWPILRHTAEITSELGGHALRGGPLVALAGYLGTQIAVVGPFLLPFVLVWAWQDRRGGAAAGSSVAPEEGAADPRRSAAMALLLWTALPLLAIGALQAIRAEPQPNWVAPAHVSLLLVLALWAAGRPVTDPQAGLRISRPRGLVIAALLQCLLVSAVAELPTLARSVQRERALPPALDLWARMRGWDQAFAMLHDQAARHRGAIVIGTNRTVIAQAAYHWRDLDLRFVAFNPGGQAHDHYQWAHPWPPVTRPGETVLILSDDEVPADLRLALRGFRAIGQARVPRSPGRFVQILLGEGVLAQPAMARAQAGDGTGGGVAMAGAGPAWPTPVAGAR